MCELGRPGCNRDRAEVSPPSHNALRVVRCFGPLSGGFEKRKILKFIGRTGVLNVFRHFGPLASGPEIRKTLQCKVAPRKQVFQGFGPLAGGP